MKFNQAYEGVLKELNLVFSEMKEEQVDELIKTIENADKVFFVGVGRVLLSLEAIAKRWAHLGVNTYIVGQITEPAISENDVLIVGSGSGESIYPLNIAKKAKSFNAKVVHIGSNPNSSMKEFSDLFVRIPVQTKLGLDNEIKSIQPMTSLFEQSLLLLGDVISLMIVKKNNLDLDSLWQYHANLE